MRVMFVDDESKVLKGIKRMLECAEVDWDVASATSGEIALQALVDHPVDVLVSDMRMSGMDGAQLLDQVSRVYPATVRIVLSGQAKRDADQRVAAPMHQYLAKPCTAESLVETISRATAMRNSLEPHGSHEILGRTTKLPSMPKVYQSVVAEMESPRGSLTNVGRLIACDPAMSAKILQLANSAIFGLNRTVTSPAQAAALIGMDTLKALVLSLSIFDQFDAPPVDGFSIDSLTDHSLQVAMLCRHIAESERLPADTVSEAFTAGLLHDVGKTILAMHASEEFANALALSRTEGRSQVDVERSIFGFGHDSIGGELLALWGLPASLVQSVSLHHSPQQIDRASLTTAGIVFIANQLCGSVAPRTANQQQQLSEFLSDLRLTDRTTAWTEPSEIFHQKPNGESACPTRSS